MERVADRDSSLPSFILGMSWNLKPELEFETRALSIPPQSWSSPTLGSSLSGCGLSDTELPGVLSEMQIPSPTP